MTESVTHSEIQAFYEAAVAERLHHYVYGNQRVERAIEFALRWIPRSATAIVDIGCGIGYSTSLIKARFRTAAVEGVDLSTEAIAAARRLFKGEEIRFTACDVLDLRLDVRADAAVMLDVYEHVPRATWPRLHAVLDGVLAPEARLVMTTPTPALQRELRAHHPDRLQVIDEEVTERDLVALGDALGGRVVLLQQVGVWTPQDYFHVVIERGSAKATPGLERAPRFSRRVTRSLQHRAHARRVRQRLGLRVTPQGRLEPWSR